MVVWIEQVIVVDFGVLSEDPSLVGLIEDLCRAALDLIAKGILTPPKEPRKEGEEWPEPAGPMIPQEVIDQVWREERGG